MDLRRGPFSRHTRRSGLSTRCVGVAHVHAYACPPTAALSSGCNVYCQTQVQAPQQERLENKAGAAGPDGQGAAELEELPDYTESDDDEEEYVEYWGAGDVGEMEEEGRLWWEGSKGGRDTSGEEEEEEQGSKRMAL